MPTRHVDLDPELARWLDQQDNPETIIEDLLQEYREQQEDLLATMPKRVYYPEDRD